MLSLIKKILQAKGKKSHHRYILESKDQTITYFELEIGQVINIDEIVQEVD